MFFIGNYLSHAATVKLPPAAGVRENVRTCFIALLIPAAGLYYGLSAFSQALQGRRKYELDEAAAAGALCMYIRSAEWKPPQREWSFEAEVETFARFTDRNKNCAFKSQRIRSLPTQVSHLSKTARGMMEVYKDIPADRLRILVFRRMEIVDQGRQQLQQQLEAEGREQRAEGVIRMAER